MGHFKTWAGRGAVVVGRAPFLEHINDCGLRPTHGRGIRIGGLFAFVFGGVGQIQRLVQAARAGQLVAQPVAAGRWEGASDNGAGGGLRGRRNFGCWNRCWRSRR